MIELEPFDTGLRAEISPRATMRYVLTTTRWGTAAVVGYVCWTSVVPAILFALFS